MTNGANTGREGPSADVLVLSAGLVGESHMVLVWSGMILLGTFRLQTLTPPGASAILPTELLPPREVLNGIIVLACVVKRFCKSVL
jgi:hypothetical protein